MMKPSICKFLLAAFVFVCGVEPSRGLDLVVSSAADTGPGTLRQAVSDVVATGDPLNMITFSPGMANQTIFLTTGEIIINGVNQSIEIDAGSKTNGITISGSSASRIFSVSNSTTLSLKGLCLADGKADDGAMTGDAGSSGGAITFLGSGDLTVSECVFQGNRAGDGGVGATGGGGGGGGGILFASGGKLTMIRSTFTANSAGKGGDATGTPGAGGIGGAVAVPMATSIELSGCRFEFNQAGAGGAAAAGNNAGDGGAGGALYLAVTGCDLLIEGCEFDGNAGGNGGNASTGTAGDGGRGGGMVIEDTGTSLARINGIIHGSVLTNNQAGSGGTATGGVGGFGGDGGGIVIQGCLLEIVNTRISGNQTGVTQTTGGASGGGLDITSGTQADATVTIVNGTINDNSAGFAGGGVMAISGPGNGVEVDIIHSTLVQNAAGNSGAGLALAAGTVNIENSIVALNTAPGSADTTTFGGTINTSGNNIIFADPVIGGLTTIAPDKMGFVPQPGSPAINQAVALVTPLTDCRGFARVFGSAADLGSVEVTYRPDNGIGKSANPATHKINNFYSATGAGQSLPVKTRGSRVARYWNSVQNDGDVDDILLLQTGTRRDYSVNGFRITGGRTNVTGAFKRGGLTLPGMAMGATVVCEHQVRDRGSRRPPPRMRLNLKARSKGSGAALDTVQAKVRAGK